MLASRRRRRIRYLLPLRLVPDGILEWEATVALASLVVEHGGTADDPTTRGKEATPGPDDAEQPTDAGPGVKGAPHALCTGIHQERRRPVMNQGDPQRRHQERAVRAPHDDVVLALCRTTARTTGARTPHAAPHARGQRDRPGQEDTECPQRDDGQTERRAEIRFQLGHFGRLWLEHGADQCRGEDEGETLDGVPCRRSACVKDKDVHEVFFV